MTKCLSCSRDLPPPKATGRPQTYCSTPCRRLAESEIRRITTRLSYLENTLSDVRTSAMLMWPPPDVAKITAEIARCNARLLELFGSDDAVPPEPVDALTDDDLGRLKISRADLDSWTDVNQPALKRLMAELDRRFALLDGDAA